MSLIQLYSVLADQAPGFFFVSAPPKRIPSEANNPFSPLLRQRDGNIKTHNHVDNSAFIMNLCYLLVFQSLEMKPQRCFNLLRINKFLPAFIIKPPTLKIFTVRKRMFLFFFDHFQI